MNFEEKTISSEYVYRGKVIDVKRDDVIISNGHQAEREVVEHTGGVVILAIKDGKVLTVRQYRYPLGCVAVELPAGKLERGEDPDFASKRELKEETGYIAKDWKSLGYIYTSPGFCDEKLYLYFAQDLEYDNLCPDDDEIIEAEEIAVEDLLRMVDTGVINDSKTICAIMRAREYLK